VFSREPRCQAKCDSKGEGIRENCTLPRGKRTAGSSQGLSRFSLKTTTDGVYILGEIEFKVVFGGGRAARGV
jgi:hypothetical protein